MVESSIDAQAIGTERSNQVLVKVESLLVDGSLDPTFRYYARPGYRERVVRQSECRKVLCVLCIPMKVVCKRFGLGAVLDSSRLSYEFIPDS